MTTALITGITGQDGGYLAERLLAQGCTVHGVLRPGEVPPEWLPNEVIRHQAEVVDGLAPVLGQVQPDEVYNLAGVSSVALSWEQSVLTAQVNGVAVVNLLEQCWRLQQRLGRPVRMLQAGSAELFAGATASPQSETTPLSPTSPYGAAKAFAHHAVHVWRGRGLPAVNALLYNHESPRRPPTFVTRKITTTVAAIARGTATELVLGNLDTRRDWGWAPDYVDAMVRALRAEPSDWVVATGRAHSVRDFVAAAFAHAGIADWEPLVRFDASFTRPADAVELVGDSSRLRDQLGWAPSVTFEELVGRMVEFDLTEAARTHAER